VQALKPAGALELRPRGCNLRRRADGNAGQPRSRDVFRSKLFVDLRRAGWPVSPVLEGRIQIGGRSFRLLGIEPVTLPAEVGNTPAIARAGLQSFVMPPGETLAAPETLSDLKLARRRCADDRCNRDAAV